MKNHEIVPQKTNEIESLNEILELDLGSLEAIVGGGCNKSIIHIGCNKTSETKDNIDTLFPTSGNDQVYLG